MNGLERYVFTRTSLFVGTRMLFGMYYLIRPFKIRYLLGFNFKDMSEDFEFVIV